MQVSINGKKREISDNTTVQELVQELSLSGPVAVELNRQVCPKNLHGQTRLRNGDTLEIVTIVGGG